MSDHPILVTGEIRVIVMLGGTTLMTALLRVPLGTYLQGIQMAAVATSPEHGHNQLAMTVLPWRSVEQIARYIAGDGTDAQRIALADGIRTKYEVAL